MRVKGEGREKVPVLSKMKSHIVVRFEIEVSHTLGGVWKSPLDGGSTLVLFIMKRLLSLPPQKKLLSLSRSFIHECGCDERLEAKTEGSKRLAYTGLHGGLEHPKIETRLIGTGIKKISIRSSI